MDRAICEVSIDDEIFESTREDFDELMTEMLYSMQQKKSDSGELTLKMKISLLNQCEEIDGEKIAYIRPFFEHKISSSIQIKDERRGGFDKDYALVLDNQKYCLKKIEDRQQNLFSMEVEK